MTKTQQTTHNMPRLKKGDMMPFFKNAKNEICQIYETEVEPVLKAGWKELTVAEEADYRAALHAKSELTSAAAIEEARLKAGLYKLFDQAEATAKTDAPKAKTATKSDAKKPTDDKNSTAPAATTPDVNTPEAGVSTDTKDAR